MKITGILGTLTGYAGLILQAITKSGSIGSRALERAYRLGTGSPVLLAAHAVTLMKDGNFETAKEILASALSSTKHWSSIKTLQGNLAVCEWKLDNIDDAIGIYLSIMKEYGDKDQAYFNEDEQLPEISRLVSENPLMMVHDFVSLGYFYIVKNDLETADYFTRAALHLQPYSASAYDNLGQIALIRKDLETAKEHFKTALEYNPQLPDSLYYMGTICEAQGCLTDAMEHYKKAASCPISGMDTISKELIDNRIRATRQRYTSL